MLAGLVVATFAALLLLAAEASAQAIPRAFDLQPGSEMRLWISDGPPSIGQPAAVSTLTGTLQVSQEASPSGDIWTVTDASITGTDVTINIIFPMSDIALELPPSTSPVGIKESDVLSIDATACAECTDFSLLFSYIYGIRPDSAVISAPLDLVFGVASGGMNMSGEFADGFTAVFDSGSGPMIGPLWVEVELELLATDPPLPPGTLEFELEETSEVNLYLTDAVGGEALPPEPGATPVATSALSGEVLSLREDSIWTLFEVSVVADDTALGLGYGLVDMTLSMPFTDVPDSSGTLRQFTSLTGIDDGSVLSIDATACAECTDFAASFGYTLTTPSGADPPAEIAFIGPLDLALGEDDEGHLTLGGSWEQGFVVQILGGDVGLWVEANLDLLPEPSAAALHATVLLSLGLVIRARRRR